MAKQSPLQLVFMRDGFIHAHRLQDVPLKKRIPTDAMNLHVMLAAKRQHPHADMTDFLAVPPTADRIHVVQLILPPAYRAAMRHEAGPCVLRQILGHLPERLPTLDPVHQTEVDEVCDVVARCLHRAVSQRKRVLHYRRLCLAKDFLRDGLLHLEWCIARPHGQIPEKDMRLALLLARHTPTVGKLDDRRTAVLLDEFLFCRTGRDEDHKALARRADNLCWQDHGQNGMSSSSSGDSSDAGP